MKSPQPDADEKVVNEYLKAQGYVTKEDLEKERLKIQQESQMERFFDSNPELEKHRDAIVAISKVDNSALEDIVVKYNFSTSDKIQKAKSTRSLVGDSDKKEHKTKTLSEMSLEEYAKWKKENFNRKGSFSD